MRDLPTTAQVLSKILNPAPILQLLGLGLLAFSPSPFSSASAQTFTTLVDFNGTNGGSPVAELIEGSDGDFYGTTLAGGSSGLGTVFRMTPEGTVTTLFNFNNSTGVNPQGRLLQDRDGNFYGTTSGGGLPNCSLGCGTVFRISATGNFTSLVRFNKANGGTPLAGLAQGRDGNFYGITTFGGSSAVDGNSGYGTIFRMTANGALTTLVNFNNANGAYPHAGLTLGTDGNFYGTTQAGGISTFGTVFRVTPRGKLTTLVNFECPNGVCAKGLSPLGEVIQGNDGNFYGTTSNAGKSGFGTLFRMTPAGALTTLANFNNTNGSAPYAGVIQGSDGNFYGTTAEGGSFGVGTVFQVTPRGKLTTLVNFNGTNGAEITAGLIQGSNGNLYGLSSVGGNFGSGTVFRLTLPAVTTAPSVTETNTR
jgi:uncharacterized repeat protein (TIGR03803 family)